MTEKRLLVPLDGTSFSRRIEPEIVRLFPPDGWRLDLLHVARLPVEAAPAGYAPAAVGTDYRLYLYGYDLPAADLHPLYDEERLEDFRQSLERDLEREVGFFRERGYNVNATVHFGEPAQAIVAYAEESGADLVAMATHHRRGLDRLMHGSVARRALDQLTIPVLLLRVEEEDEDDEATAGRDRDAAGTTDPRSMDGERGQAADPGLAARGANVPRDDQEVTPAPTGPAILGGQHGRGVLTIVFGDEGRAVGTEGSWFPEDPDADVGALEEAQRAGRSVIYEGLAVDAETAGHDDQAGEQVRREVQVTAVRRYRDYGGDTRTLVSFELVGEPDQTDVPDQYSRSEFDALPLSEVADLTGLTVPETIDRAQELEFREKAWQSYQLDIEHRDEWGTARQSTPLPHGE